MKRKLAALMCGLMCVTAFTGCSSTELSYLKMSSDLLDTMAACRVEGKMQADIDFDTPGRDKFCVFKSALLPVSYESDV